MSDPLKGDQVFANTILRMRDSILHFEFQLAIADGDIGRAMNVMAVSQLHRGTNMIIINNTRQVWTFTFAGSGKTKYTNELLEVACNFEYEYSDLLQEAVLNNWLCNLTGLDGCWFPMDLLEEHNIRQLKGMSDRRHGSFSDDFFKLIISYNIRYFLSVKDSLRILLGLGEKSGTHHQKKKAVALKLLGQCMAEHQLHRFRPGRSYGHQAQDDFAEGYHILSSTTRIADFLKRTLADVSDVNGNDQDENLQMDIDMDDTEQEAAHTVPLPNVWQNGVLISGDESDENDEEEEDMNRQALVPLHT